MADLLDNITWSSLSGPQARFTAGSAAVRRYAAGFSALVGFPEPQCPDFDTLSAFCDIGEQIYCPEWTGAAPEGWCIHAEIRDEFMITSQESREHEQRFLDGFYNNLTVEQDALFREMDRRMQLDAWGLDCAFFPDSEEILFFEANACMNLLTYDSRAEFSYLNPHIKRIRRAIRDLIVWG